MLALICGYLLLAGLIVNIVAIIAFGLFGNLLDKRIDRIENERKRRMWQAFSNRVHERITILKVMLGIFLLFQIFKNRDDD